MRKEFVVKSINASPDGPQHVIVLLTSTKDLQEQNQLKSRFDPSDMMNPDKMKNMVNDLNKMFSGMGGGGGMMPGMGGGTSIKLDMHEYKELNLSIGDKIYLDISKDEDLGI